MKTLSRRVRSAEMRYAISRAAEYDVQSKLTWLVDSLLTNRPGLPSPSEDDERKDEAGTMVRTLQRILRGRRSRPRGGRSSADCLRFAIQHRR